MASFPSASERCEVSSSFPRVGDRCEVAPGARPGRSEFATQRQKSGLSMLRTEVRKAAKLAQKLGQLQLFIAVFPQERMGRLAYFGPI